MVIFLYIKIINKDLKKQLYSIFKNITELKIKVTEDWKIYNDFLKDINNKDKDNKELYILKLSKHGKDYIKYYEIIKESIESIQSKINGILNNKIHMICPFESIILYYIIQIIRDGAYSDFTINELYNIVDIYTNSYNDTYKGHTNCLCKKLFKTNISTNNDTMKNYLINHYNNISNIEKIYDAFLLKYNNINWLINHFVSFGGNNDDFKLYKQFKLIGYDKDNAYIVYVKPQFNDINYNEILIDSIYDTFLIKTIKNTCAANYNRFSNKNIITIVFSLDNKTYNIFEWKNKDICLIDINNKILFQNIKNKIINKYLIESNLIYHFFIYWNKQFISKELSDEIIIKEIIKKYKKEKCADKSPSFIIKLFEKIEILISYKVHTLDKYENKEMFMELLKKYITESVDDFLEIMVDK